MSSLPERIEVVTASESHCSIGGNILQMSPEVVLGAALRMGRRPDADPAVLRRICTRLRAQVMSGELATPAVLAWLERRIDRREDRR